MAAKRWSEEEIKSAVVTAVMAQAVGIDPDVLARTVVEHLGRSPIQGESFECAGWWCERIDGKDIPGMKGRPKRYRGWKLTKGDLVKYVPGENSSDAPEWAAKQQADAMTRFQERGLSLDSF